VSDHLANQSGLFAMLRELAELAGVSGAEAPVRDYLARTLQEHVDELQVDALGNLIAIKRGNGRDRMKVAVMAHMDEVGLIVSGADESGQLKFRVTGGIEPHALLAKRVRVGSEQLPGVIGYKPVHLQSRQEREKEVDLQELRVDIGAKDEKEALAKAPLGTAINFETKVHFAGTAPDKLPAGDRLPEKGRLIGKAFDDRLGCLALAALLRGPRLPYDLYGIFTIQEEVGLRGARVAAWGVEPDLAVVLETTFADDLPSEEDKSPTTRLGRGPAITVMDRTVITDPRLVRYFLSKAAAAGIPAQIKQPGVGGTDAGAVQSAHGGVPVAVLSVPSRYIHSPVSLMDLEDLNNLLRLLAVAIPDLQQLGKGIA